VHVLAGQRPGARPPALPEILSEHAIAARLHVLPVGRGVFGGLLLAQAHALGADLLVMGAYTHNFWRELLLGGVTSHMMAHADLPVLMRH
jgi:nucleotide-binding universal stress UspA family protein